MSTLARVERALADMLKAQLPAAVAAYVDANGDLGVESAALVPGMVAAGPPAYTMVRAFPALFCDGRELMGSEPSEDPTAAAVNRYAVDVYCYVEAAEPALAHTTLLALDSCVRGTVQRYASLGEVGLVDRRAVRVRYSEIESVAGMTRQGSRVELEVLAVEMSVPEPPASGMVESVEVEVRRVPVNEPLPA